MKDIDLRVQGSLNGNPISDFITWASQRIEREFLENERVLVGTGEKDYMPTQKPGRGRRIDIKQKLFIIKAIMDIKHSGKTIRDGCEEMGIHPCTFGRWKSLLESKGML
jgi:hypothetical protein